MLISHQQVLPKGISALAGFKWRGPGKLTARTAAWRLFRPAQALRLMSTGILQNIHHPRYQP